MASYAEQYGEDFRGIESVAKVRDELRILDMNHPAVRQAVAEGPVPKRKGE